MLSDRPFTIKSVSTTPATPIPSEARAYRLLSDLELALEWRRLGCPTRLGPVLREFLMRYYERQEEQALAGTSMSLAPHRHGPVPRPRPRL
jgi:hypothetical protein